jgi:hypothetical protein
VAARVTKGKKEKGKAPASAYAEGSGETSPKLRAKAGPRARREVAERERAGVGPREH